LRIYTLSFWERVGGREKKRTKSELRKRKLIAPAKRYTLKDTLLSTGRFSVCVAST
jgi:hypothetical protein